MIYCIRKQHPTEISTMNDIKKLLLKKVFGKKVAKMSPSNLKLYALSLAEKMEVPGRYGELLKLLCECGGREYPDTIYAKEFFDQITKLLSRRGHKVRWNYFPGGNSIEFNFKGMVCLVVNDRCVIPIGGKERLFVTPASAVKFLLGKHR